MKDGKDSVIKSISRYSLSNFYRQALGLITAFLRPKLLRPELYGLWNLLNVIITYASYTHLGSRSSMRYQIPYLEARHDSRRINELQGAVFYGSLYLNLIFVLFFILFACKPGLRLEVRLGLFFTCIIVIFTGYYEYYVSLLKGLQDFRRISAANYLKASVTCVCSLVLIYLWGIYGALGSVLLSLLAVIYYLQRRNIATLPPAGFQLKLFNGSIRNGLPIVFFDIIGVVLRTVDKLVVSFFLGNKQLGYYGISTMILGSLMNIPGVSREVIEPKLMQSLSSATAETNFVEYFLKPSLNTAYLMPLLLGPVIFCLPVFIATLLPHYVTGIRPAQIMVFGAYFLAMSYPGRGIVVAYNWQLQAASVMCLAVVINLVLSITLVKAGFGIGGVAAASGVSFFVLAVVLFVFVIKKSAARPAGLRLNLLCLSIPFPVMVAAIFGLNRFVGLITANSFIALFVQLPLFWAIHFGLIVFVSKKNILSFSLRRKS